MQTGPQQENFVHPWGKLNVSALPSFHLPVHGLRTENMDTTQATFSADDPECAICLGPFTEPKIMFCGHILCRGCLITWVTAQRREVFCPLCRNDVLDIPIINKTEDFISFEVDCLPTDHVIMATARGKHDVTPDTCSGCEGLLCRWRTAPHPQCPGQDVQNTEADARAAVNDLSDKVEMMIEGQEAEAEFLVDMSKIEGEVQDRTRDSVSWLKTETGKLCSVLFSHQHLLQRM
ncbi:hypothetical protein C0Q70_14504 [Pomacea canaliculata]|uniref:RING-type domain-containing protein n=1 Tax=Pomacea canaliculata TaxID=400727 RepID=A0A2T7NS84_POMCA|nr:hypothetical protein C0Q70_14504 [Pomacea canaliculata]